MNLQLSTKYYVPQGNPVACIVVVHGMQEHKKRYAPLGEFLKEQGFVVATYDLPGHGPNANKEGSLGYFGETDGWKTLVESAHFMVQEMHKKYPGLPVWYFGHSMGTIIGRCYLQKYDDEIDGMMLSGLPCYNSFARPGMVIAKTIRMVKGPKGTSKLLDELMTGQFNKQIKGAETEVDWLSVDKENVRRYLEDELCGVPFTVQGYIDLIGGMIQMHTASLYQVKHANLPLRCYAGSDDPCIGGKEGFEDSVHFLQCLGYTNISKVLYEGKRHEILNEDVRQEMMENMADFVEKNIRG